MFWVDALTSWWRDFWPALKRRDAYPKLIIIALLCVLSFALVLIASSREWKGCETVASALFIATVVYSLEKIFEWFSSLHKNYRMRRFFGIDEKRDIAIFVPEYFGQSGTLDRSYTYEIERNWPALTPAPPTWDITSHPANPANDRKCVAAFNDVRAAAEIASIVTKAGGWANEKLLLRPHIEAVGSHPWTYFSIGIFSNWTSKYVYDQMCAKPQTCQFVLDRNSEDGATIYVRPAKSAPDSWKDWVSYSKGDNWEYAIIAKIKSESPKNKQRVAFIIGGMSSRGTRTAGEFFRQHWEKQLYEHSPQGDVRRVRDKAFVAILRVNYAAESEEKDDVVLHNCVMWDEVTPTFFHDVAPRKPVGKQNSQPVAPVDAKSSNKDATTIEVATLTEKLKAGSHREIGEVDGLKTASNPPPAKVVKIPKAKAKAPRKRPHKT